MPCLPKNNKFGLVASKCLIFDLRKLKSGKVLKDSNVILGDLNLLGWVVFKSDQKFIDYLNESLAKLCAIQKRGYWEILVNTDEQKLMLFPSDFKGIRFEENVDVPFHILEEKFKYNFSVAICHMKTTNKFSLFDFKMYRLNLITNDSFIGHHQKAHRDFKVTFPNVIMKLSENKIEINKRQNNSYSIYNYISIKL